MFTAHCNGCEVPRVGDISLQPGDHLAVCFTEFTKEQMEGAGSYIDHESMIDLKSKDYLTLFDCLDAFTNRYSSTNDLFVHYTSIISRTAQSGEPMSKFSFWKRAVHIPIFCVLVRR